MKKYESVKFINLLIEIGWSLLYGIIIMALINILL